MARLCLNMIVKNESENITRCLEALAPHIDCYVICDTGSTDDTIAIIEATMSGHGVQGEVVKAPFHNFEQARNAALEGALASNLEFDYLLLCDADMELEVGDPGFRSRLDQPAYSLVQRTESGLEYPNIRIVRRDVPMRYRGVTHEYLDVGDTPRPNLEGVGFFDHASGANRAGKYQRDIDLLLEGLRAEPDSPRYVFYLANSYHDLGDLETAMEWYERREAMAGYAEERFYSSYRIAHCLLRLGRADEAVVQFLETYDDYPHRAEPLHSLAMHFQGTQQHQLSLMAAETGSRVPLPGGGLFVETEVYTWRLLDAMAVALYWTGRIAEGAQLNRRLLDLAPADQHDRIRANLAFCEAGPPTR